VLLPEFITFQKWGQTVKDKSGNPVTAAELLKLLQGDKSPELTLEAILNGLVRHLGGVDEFCKQLTLDYMKAKPGSPTRQRIGQLIANLAIAFAKIREPTNPPLDTMSTEDLEAVLAEALRGVAQSDRPNTSLTD
jgi:hypothetical protein